MTATVVIIVLSAWTVLLTVFGEREKTRTTARKCDFISAVAGVLAAVVGIILSQSFVGRIPDAEAAEWAKESLEICFAVVFTVTGLLIVICSVTSLMSGFNKKLHGGFAHKLRVTMIAVAGVFVFSLSFIGYFVSNSNAPLDTAVIVTTAGLGLMMRFCSLIENKGR